MDDDLTPAQALLVFGLLARHGVALQSDLTPKVGKSNRDALIRDKLIESSKAGRSLRLTLTDDGWAWAGAHLTADLPPAQRVLHDLLTRLDQHLTRRRLSLATFIGTPLAENTSGGPKRKGSGRTKPKGTGQTEPTKTGRKRSKPLSVREQVEAAYLAATDGRKDRAVRLADLRPRLPDLDRPTLDAALKSILAGDAKAVLMRHDDPRQLDAADHEAAISSAGQSYHLLWIAS